MLLKTWLTKCLDRRFCERLDQLIHCGKVPWSLDSILISVISVTTGSTEVTTPWLWTRCVMNEATQQTIHLDGFTVQRKKWVANLSAVGIQLVFCNSYSKYWFYIYDARQVGYRFEAIQVRSWIFPHSCIFLSMLFSQHLWAGCQ